MSSTLKSRLTADMKSSMKSGDKHRLGVVRLMLAALKQVEVDERIELDSAQAGDIVAAIGLKNVQTGHTLCDPDQPATLEPMVFPDPVISMAVAPVDKAASEKLGTSTPTSR